MDEVITIEYRGMSGELAVGATLLVEAVSPGVLRLRRAPAKPVKEDKAKPAATNKKGVSRA